MKAKSSELKRNYLLPRDLVRMTGCPEKKIREYCKTGKIREAKKTPGGQWRISKQLSQDTRLFLTREAFRVDWPWVGDGKEFQGDLEPESTKGLMLAHVLDRAEDVLYDTDITESDMTPEKQNVVDRFDQLIDESEIDKAKRIIAKGKGEKFTRYSTAEKRVWELKLHGSVKQFYIKYRCRPNVEDISKMMGISRNKFNRLGLTSKKLKQAYRIVVDEFLSVAADARDHDATLRANEAKKPGFEQLGKDYDRQMSDFAPLKRRRLGERRN